MTWLRRLGAIGVALSLVASPAAALAANAPHSSQVSAVEAAILDGPATSVAAAVGRAGVVASGDAPAVSPQEALPTTFRAANDELALRVLERRYPIPTDSGEGRRIVYSNSRQRVWLVESDGSLVDTYLVSGRRGVPRAGTYRVYSKSEKAWAGHDGITMNLMVRFTRSPTSGLGIGFHDLPKYSNGKPMQTEAELGQYRSGGCVRQSHDKAAALWDWAPLGTTVVVLR